MKRINNDKKPSQFERRVSLSSYCNDKTLPTSHKKRLNHSSNDNFRLSQHSSRQPTPSYRNKVASSNKLSQHSYRQPTPSYRNKVASSNKLSQHSYRQPTPSHRNKVLSSNKNTSPKKTITTNSNKSIRPKKSVKRKITIGTFFLIITTLGIYGYISIFNPIPSNDNGDTLYEGSYDGSGQLLNKVDAVLSNCDINEQNALKTSGFTRIYYGSICDWTKIYTIEGSPMLTQSFVDEVGEEIKRAFEPIIERYPERLKRVLDREGGTINFILVYGATAWGAYYNGEYMFAKRASARDLDIFHEIGHYFDMDDSPGNWRKHVDSVMTAEHVDIIDQYCNWTNGNGDFIYGEFVAEQYGKMFYPDKREQLKNEFPVVYERLLNFVPTPSSYVPFD